ncbi:MAG: mcsA [Fusobacteria bacterium]|nr:MAG: mcsA [Fusobacteriota bacterium]KAF0229628.1 MAG: hypothetical protein FD182_18 [Fusobacteriota bacterium]
MICQVCGKNEATICMVKMSNNNKETIYICPVCAGQMDDKLIGSINQLLSPMFDTFFSNSNKLGHDINQICPTCGQTRREWEESRTLNCKDCIQFLDSDEIHNGKIPKNNKEELYVINLIKEKEGHLKQLIAEEKYEEAAKIRDEIKDLKGDFQDDKQTS